MTSEPRLRTLPQAVLDAMPGAVAHVGPAAQILGVNAAWRTLASLDRILPSTNVGPGADYLEACHRAAEGGSPAADDVAAAVRAVLTGHETPAVLEYRLSGQQSTAWIEVTVTRLDGDGYTGALVMHGDISARKAAAEAARRTENLYRAIVESAPVGIYQTSPEGKILAANQSLADIVGALSPDDLIGLDIHELEAPSQAVLPAGETAGPTPVEIEWRRLDDVPIWVEVAARGITDHRGGIAYYEGFVYDISERKRLEAQLIQSQRMETVGRLAGGIAHDFNNLLTVMIGYAEMLQETGELPAPLRPSVNEILAAARRAAELTGRMLAFARKQQVQPRAIDVNDVVRGTEGLLRRIIGEDVHLVTELAPGLRPVLVDPAQLEQVLMNLAVNSRDAMPGGGTLTIATSAVDVTEDQARRRPGLRSGRYVQVAVSDTGIGMDADTLARVFEPFFTTKEPGKGTGLGLAMCYGIVKQAGGFIGCESAKGLGTTCTVLLPETASAVEPARPNSVPAFHGAAPPSRILVVEDETVVRQFVADVLRAAGHEVHATGSPHEGLEMARQAGGSLDLLITDVVMPHLDGVTLYGRIRERHPRLQVVLMSGYQDRARVENDEGVALLPKPFTAAQLKDVVAAALSGKRHG